MIVDVHDNMTVLVDNMFREVFEFNILFCRCQHFVDNISPFSTAVF